MPLLNLSVTLGLKNEIYNFSLTVLGQFSKFNFRLYDIILCSLAYPVSFQVHTYIIFWSMAEPLFTIIEVPKKRLGLIFIGIYAAAYTVWSYILYLKLGKWVYPILNVLSDVQRVLFIIVAYILVVCLFLSTRVYQKKFGRKNRAIKAEWWFE